jgi:hypothetical protein
MSRARGMGALLPAATGATAADTLSLPPDVRAEPPRSGVRAGSREKGMPVRHMCLQETQLTRTSNGEPRVLAPLCRAQERAFVSKST